MEEAKRNSQSPTSLPYKNIGNQPTASHKQPKPQAQPKPHGSVLDAKASSYLPRGNIADCKSKIIGCGTKSRIIAALPHRS